MIDYLATKNNKGVDPNDPLKAIFVLVVIAIISLIVYHLII